MQRLLPLLILFTLTASLAATTDPARPHPNIIYIVADDLGWGELGCYGQTKIRTPSIDRIATEGVRFTQHYSGAPVCAPARCVVMTGRHPGHAIVRNNWEAGGWGPDEAEGQYPLPPGTPTIGALLQAKGYATAAIGKWGLGGPGTTGEPNRHGFDLFYGYLCQRVAHNLYPTHLWRNTEKETLEGNTWGNHVGAVYSHDLMAEEALAFIRTNRDRPFFLYVPFHIPHLALQVPEDSLAEYRGLWPDPPYEGGKGYLPHPTPRAAYAAMVTRMDRDIGRMLDLLDELGLAGNTIVLFSSDNGATHDVGGADSPFFESGGPFRGRKGSVYEGGLRVPLVARWPGWIPAGGTSEHVSAFWDVLPTLAELAGADVPADTDGISFVPALLGQGSQQTHNHLYWEFPGYGGQQAVRVGDYKAVRRSMRKGNTTIALYDLASDVGESRDIAAEHPALVNRVAAIMEFEHDPSEPFPLPILDRPAVEATSLLGNKLKPMKLDPQERAKREANLDEAARALAADPDGEEAIIWFGRRLAYLGRYREAIDVFTRGLKLHPDSPRLLRHRGHRYITIRYLASAIADLERAAKLARGTADEVEPDGLPNALGIPTSTLQTNIWYHLGLARYLVGEYDGAADAYRACLDLAGNDDMRAAAAYWLYLSARRAGRDDQVRAALAVAGPDVDVIENHAYLALLRLYRGDVDLADVTGGDDAIQGATAAYGLAMSRGFSGDADAARRDLETIVKGAAWPAFGHIAAEADLAR